MKTIIALATLISISVACASTQKTNSTPHEHDVITREQLLTNHFNSAFDAVEALHSNWLIARPDSYRARTRVIVYFDNVRLGGVETLRTIAVRPVSYIRHYNGIDATARWGLDHGSGVIYVSTQPVVLPVSTSGR